MIIKHLKHGSARQRPKTASARKSKAVRAVKYLTDKPDNQASVLFGDEQGFTDLLAYGKQSCLYESVVFSFEETVEELEAKGLNKTALAEEAEDYLNTLMCGLDRSRYDAFCVMHTDKEVNGGRRVDVHMLISKEDLATGNQITPYLHDDNNDFKRKDLFTKIFNKKYTTSTPEQKPENKAKFSDYTIKQMRAVDRNEAESINEKFFDKDLVASEIKEYAIDNHLKGKYKNRIDMLSDIEETFNCKVKPTKKGITITAKIRVAPNIPITTEEKFRLRDRIFWNDYTPEIDPFNRMSKKEKSESLEAMQERLNKFTESKSKQRAKRYKPIQSQEPANDDLATKYHQAREHIRKIRSRDRFSLERLQKAQEEKYKPTLSHPDTRPSNGIKTFGVKGLGEPIGEKPSTSPSKPVNPIRQDSPKGQAGQPLTGQFGVNQQEQPTEIRKGKKRLKRGTDFSP